MLVLALLLPGPALAAGFSCTQPATSGSPSSQDNQLAELDEVFVVGSEPTRRAKDLGAWLKLLEGQYSYEGHIELCGSGNVAGRRSVTGKSDCVAIYNAHTGSDEYITGSDPPPGVTPVALYCAIDVRWPQVLGEGGAPVPGGESNLSPAVVIYGVVPDLPGIQFMQIDSGGIATQARGKLRHDTLTTRESCSFPEVCKKVTRITARPGSHDIVMRIDMEVDSLHVLSQVFLLRRVSNLHTPRSKQNLRRVGER